MSILEALILGAVQGFTEFIPISSSGHLVLVPEVLGWDPAGLSFDVLLHVGSLLALAVYFRADLMRIARSLVSGEAEGRHLLLLLAIGTIPAAVAGFALEDFFETRFGDAPTTALSLILTALILIAAEQMVRRRRSEGRPLDELGVLDAGGVGAAQAFSILPGISRSGSTIAAGLALGMSRETAARFAFLLAIPALLGAAILKLPDLGADPIGLGAALVGFLASAVSSYLAIAGLIHYLRSRTLYPFAIYCLVAAPIFYLLVR